MDKFKVISIVSEVLGYVDGCLDVREEDKVLLKIKTKLSTAIAELQLVESATSPGHIVVHPPVATMDIPVARPGMPSFEDRVTGPLKALQPQTTEQRIHAMGGIVEDKVVAEPVTVKFTPKSNG